jgi:hypothetical protein
MAEDLLIEGPLPMLLNLGDFGTINQDMIGHARIYQMEDGRKKIEIVLNDVTSVALTDLCEIFKLKGIGFAGVARRSQDGR